MSDVLHGSLDGMRAAVKRRPDRDRWEGLNSLIRARLVVATLALPVGVLLRPEATAQPTWVLWSSLIIVGLMSTVFAFGVRLRRAATIQTYLQITADLALVTWLAGQTGARDSQFVLFYALVVITGGVLARFAGGLFAAAGASIGFLALPWVASLLGLTPATDALRGALPGPGLLVAFLTMVGVLSGVLGERVQRTRADLERTAKELDRVRVDNDVIIRHLATGVLTVDEKGIVAYLNPAAEQVLGLRTLDVRTRHVRLALPERLAPLRDVVADTLEKQTRRTRAELMVRTASGQPLPVGISTNLLMHEGAVTGVVAVFSDLTDVREMERRVRRSETLAEVGALAATIAHELRNGLKPISGSVEYLERELKPEGESAVLMTLIARECGRLNKFVTDLLTYSRERELALEPVGLDEHLRELCESRALDPRNDANRPRRIRYEGGGTDDACVSIDREQMRQVWLNLVNNAMEAMSDDGLLTVRWRDVEGGRIVVEFSDNGPGITAENLPRVGQPFFTTKQGGTGLGLAIAQRIVERHGGTLTLESEVGRGTVARVQLLSTHAELAQAA